MARLATIPVHRRLAVLLTTPELARCSARGAGTATRSPCKPNRVRQRRTYLHEVCAGRYRPRDRWRSLRARAAPRFRARSASATSTSPRLLCVHAVRTESVAYPLALWPLPVPAQCRPRLRRAAETTTRSRRTSVGGRATHVSPAAARRPRRADGSPMMSSHVQCDGNKPCNVCTAAVPPVDCTYTACVARA